MSFSSSQSSYRSTGSRTSGGSAKPNITLDLYSLLEIKNPQCGYVTCVGHAPSKGRRCQWGLYGGEVEQKLQFYSNRVPFEMPTFAELRAIAVQALCKEYHRGQADKIARQWKDIIEEAEMDELSRRMGSAGLGGESSKQQSQREREEKRAREEDERRKKEKKEKQEAEERRKREETAREEARKEKGRQERVNAEYMAKLWKEAWERYVSAFQKFKDGKTRIIPWPVKSGLHSDVTEVNVAMFYRLAVPTSSLRQTIKLMDQECLRWHPDKMKRLVSHFEPTEMEKIRMAIVARQVIEVRKEFQERRSS